VLTLWPYRITCAEVRESIDKGQGENVFRLRNFNIIGFSTFLLLPYMFRSQDIHVHPMEILWKA
jgi:hypothetical protein